MSPSLRLGDNENVTLNQRTLIIILGAMGAAAMAYADLKSDRKNDRKDLTALSTIVATDHDILIRLDQRTVWISENRNGSISAGVGPKPEASAGTSSMPAH